MRFALAFVFFLATPLVARAGLPDADLTSANETATSLISAGSLKLSEPAGQAPDPRGRTRRGVMGLGRYHESQDESVEPPDVSPYAVRGVDVSHYEGDIDWGRLGSSGLSFVFMKATEGGDFVDDHFAANWASATSAGLAKGAYHFYNFCGDGASQAANFISHVPVEAGALPPTIDLEESDDCATMPDKASFRNEFADFVAAIELVYGQQPILYVDYSIYAKYFAGENDPYKLWIADVFHRAPSLPDGKPWTLWQYDWHGHVPGIESEVDLDAFAGSAQDLAALQKPAGTALAGLP